MMRLALIVALTLSLGLSIWSGFLLRSNAALTADNAQLSRSVLSLKAQAAHNRLAREVERVRAARIAARRAEAAAAVETIQSGDIPDAPLDPRVSDLVNGLQQQAR